MERDEDIKQLDNKLNLLLYNQERNKELDDLSRLENTNFTIFISVLAIVLSITFGFQVNLLELSLETFFIIALTFSTVLLIFIQVYLIYKNDIRKRFDFFIYLIVYIFLIPLFPFSYFYIHFTHLWYDMNFLYLNIFFISTLIYNVFTAYLFGRYIAIPMEFRFVKRFPKIYTESIKDSYLFKAMVKFISDELKKSIELKVNEAFESAIKDEINKIKNYKNDSNKK